MARQLPAAQRSQPPQPLIYVDVDPALASAQPPANSKFYSTQNAVAANPEKKVPSDLPQINGTQEEVMKTVAPGLRTAPLQPSPRVERTAETAAAETKETAASQAPPKPASTPGNLAEGKPALKVQEIKGTSESETGTGAAPAAGAFPPAHSGASSGKVGSARRPNAADRRGQSRGGRLFRGRRADDLWRL